VCVWLLAVSDLVHLRAYYSVVQCRKSLHLVPSASYNAVVLAKPRPAALLAVGSSAAVLGDARPAALLALFSLLSSLSLSSVHPRHMRGSQLFSRMNAMASSSANRTGVYTIPAHEFFSSKSHLCSTCLPACNKQGTQMKVSYLIFFTRIFFLSCLARLCSCWHRREGFHSQPSVLDLRGRHHTSAYVNIRQHTSAHVSICLQRDLPIHVKRARRAVGPRKDTYQCSERDLRLHVKRPSNACKKM